MAIAGEIGWNLKACCIGLPPEDDLVRADSVWLKEIEGLREDLKSISADGTPSGLSSVLLVGDWNMQPNQLGGKKTRSRARDKAFTSLCEDWGLVLHNPCLRGASGPALPRLQVSVQSLKGFSMGACGLRPVERVGPKSFSRGDRGLGARCASPMGRTPSALKCRHAECM